MFEQSFAGFRRIPFSVFAFAAVFGVMAWMWVESTADSGGPYFLIVLGIPLLAIVGFIALSRTIAAVRQKKTASYRQVAVFLAAAAMVIALVCGLKWRDLHPPGVFYEFFDGATGSWNAVQFGFFENGKRMKGPWVGGAPLKVDFPDLNRDGRRDIRVRKLGGETIVYYFTPSDDGKRYWMFNPPGYSHLEIFRPEPW